MFDDMIADIMTNKKLQTIIKELFIRCRKINISLVFTTQSYFCVPKDTRLSATHYLIMKISNRKKLQIVANNYSADIDYNNFVRIYWEYTRKPYSFLTIDTMLTSKWSSKIQKKFVWFFIKITVTDQIKSLDRNIMQNEAQYDLDRKTAKISASSSNNLDKYEYLTCEDLDLKPSTVEQARFEYFPLSNIFNKGLKEEDKK